jgi:hypothetical protein
MLEKVTGVALVNKLWVILLMEADFNYMNRWIFGNKSINRMYPIGYIPEDQYMSAGADKFFDRINQIIMSLLLLAIVGMIGNVVTMLHPIQTMKFFQRRARGVSTTFMGGWGQDNPLQGVCQGNGVAPACWLMLSSVFVHCYKHEGFGLRIISPISGAIIDFLEEIYVDNTDLIITRPEMTTPLDTQEGLRDVADSWASWLNASGRAINPKKSQ